MSLIDETYFIGELNLPNTNDENVIEVLEQFIDKYEKSFLTDLLGYELYKEFTAGLKVSPVDQKWKDLRDGAEYTYNQRLYKWDGLIRDETQTSPIANYIYYHWQRDAISQTTAIGEVASKSENSIRVSPSGKMIRAWNEMVNELWKLVSFLDAKASTYPSWSWYGDANGTYFTNHARLKDIFYPINSMNL